MNDLKLQKGDGFVVKTAGWISAPIRWVEKWKSLDSEATYNHAGIIVSETGETFESLERIDHYKLSNYKGCQVLIFRRVEMSNDLYQKGWEGIKTYDGKIYPAWRFVLFLLSIAKWLHFTYPVCSELLFMFECKCGLRVKWAGYSPDNIADEVKISKFYLIKFEGVLYG
jgi:hypothetical protein